MVIKILAASMSFNGVIYNEEKNDKGVSELMAAENFNALDKSLSTRNDYIKYLEAVSSTNKRVKNKQFHAVLSTKGRKHSPEELKKYAELYIKEMGYSNNPYLIYSHSDTPNNHVHIVSSRVDKKGKKISDKYERIRTQKFIQKHFSIDAKMNTKNAIEEANKYSFSTVPQFKLILENKGFIVSEKGEEFSIVKHGESQATISKKDIDSILKSYSEPIKRRKQLSAIFDKYSKGLDKNEFKKLMKEKFGLDIIYHYGKNKQQEKPYGYSIIDHKEKIVFKGSKIYSLNSILEAKNRVQKELAFEGLLSANLVSGKQRFSELKSTLKNYGYSLDHKGNVKVQNTKENFYQLSADNLKSLHYNDRLFNANGFSGNSTKNEFLAKVFFVKKGDIKTSKISEIDEAHYKNILLNNIHQRNTSLKESLKENDLEMFKYNDKYFLVDKKDSVFIDLEKLGVDYKFSSNDVTVLQESQTINNLSNNSNSSNLMDYFDLLDSVLYTAEDDDTPAKKRKKNKGRKR